MSSLVLDDREIQALMASLQKLNGKKMSVIAFKVGKEALFGMMKVTPVAKKLKFFQLRDSDGKPVLNRSGEPIWVKNPQRWDKSMSGQREGYLSSKTGRRATKIAKGMRFLKSAWYQAKMGFKIKTGKAGEGAQSHGAYYSGDSQTHAELMFENSVPYSGSVDDQRKITQEAMFNATKWLTESIMTEMDKLEKEA